ncbi:MAG: DUF433 domain-containing protein [Rhodospirillales bacterium]|nr:DUF433 domain-containing protein [Rhodospirillales bacterium]
MQPHRILAWSAVPGCRGTRVVVRALFENLEDGATIDDFLKWFPKVTRRLIDAVLEHTVPGLSG